jgi:hypothetical protein
LVTVKLDPEDETWHDMLIVAYSLHIKNAVLHIHDLISDENSLASNWSNPVVIPEFKRQWDWEGNKEEEALKKEATKKAAKEERERDNKARMERFTSRLGSLGKSNKSVSTPRHGELGKVGGWVSE